LPDCAYKQQQQHQLLAAEVTVITKRILWLAPFLCFVTATYGSTCDVCDDVAVVDLALWGEKFRNFSFSFFVYRFLHYTCWLACLLGLLT